MKKRYVALSVVVCMIATSLIVLPLEACLAETKTT